MNRASSANNTATTRLQHQIQAKQQPMFGNKAPRDLGKKRKFDEFKQGNTQDYQTDNGAKQNTRSRKLNEVPDLDRKRRQQHQETSQIEKKVNLNSKIQAVQSSKRTSSQQSRGSGYLTESIPSSKKTNLIQPNVISKSKKEPRKVPKTSRKEPKSAKGRSQSQFKKQTGLLTDNEDRSDIDSEEDVDSSSSDIDSDNDAVMKPVLKKALSPQKKSPKKERIAEVPQSSVIIPYQQEVISIIKAWAEERSNHYLNRHNTIVQSINLGRFKSHSYNSSTGIATYTFWDVEIKHKDCAEFRAHQTKCLILRHCGGFNTSLSQNVDWEEYWIKNIVFEFKTPSKKINETPTLLLNAYIEVADVVTFDKLEAETTKNLPLKPQMHEFKAKIPEFIQTINSKQYKVCVSGLTRKKIDIEDFMSYQWGDQYFYMIKFSDNIKSFKTYRNLETHAERGEFIEYLFDAKNKSGGPRKIEIFRNDEHQLDDFNEHTLDEFLELYNEIFQSRPHIFKDRSLSKPKSSKQAIKSTIKKSYVTDAEQLIRKSDSKSSEKKNLMPKLETDKGDYLSDSNSLSSSLDEQDVKIKTQFSGSKDVTIKYPLNINMLNPTPQQQIESDSSHTSRGKNIYNFDKHLTVKNNETLRMTQQPKPQQVYEEEIEIVANRSNRRVARVRDSSEEEKPKQRAPIVIEVLKSQLDSNLRIPSKSRKRSSSVDSQKSYQNSKFRQQPNNTIMEDDEDFMSDGGDQKVVNTSKLGKTLGNRTQVNGVKERKATPRVYENEYDKVCASLQLSAVPEVLPCRDKERNYIKDYLINGIQNGGSSSSLYISGMPGTGKTATTLEVVKKLLRESESKKKSSQQFEFIHINAMSLTNPNLVYTILNEKITGRRVNPTSSATFLDEFFKKKDKIKILRDRGWGKYNKKSKVEQDKLKSSADKLRVLLIDELDALVTKKQTLLYNLFDWPCHSHSKLLVIAIANTMDLPEKLQQKIASRIGNNRLVYEPYNKDQITQIIRSRITGSLQAPQAGDSISIFDERAIVLVASKVSSYSGDIRRSLQVAKRALEIAREEFIEKFGEDFTKKLTQVSYQHVIKAFNELYNSKQCQLLKSLRRYEILVVMAIYVEQVVTKSEKVLLDKVQDRCDNMLNQLNWFGASTTSNGQISLSNKRNNKQIPQGTFREIVKRLQSFGILTVTVETAGGKITDNVFTQLVIYHDEITAAFEENEIYQTFEMTIKIHTNSGGGAGGTATGMTGV